MSEAFNPKVSIIIPVYNGANYMREAIDSALAQTYSNIEVLVINDGSNDNGETDRIAKSYGARIKYFTKPNGGVATALNFGIEKMEGDYFSWLSHDDVYNVEKIEREINYIKNKPCAIVYSGYATINQNGDKISEYIIPDKLRNNIEILIGIDIRYTLNGCSMLIPKDIIKNNHGFNAALLYTQDYDLWWRLSQECEFIYLDEILIYSRQHDNQTSRIENKKVVEEADSLHKTVIDSIAYDTIFKVYKLDEVIYIYHCYKNNGYVGTAIMLLKKILDYAKAERIYEIYYTLINEVTLTKNEELNRWKNLFNGVNAFTKPNILIYQNVWNFGGVERVISNLLPYLQKKYNVVLITANERQEKGFSIPKNCSHCKIAKPDYDIAYRLAAICKLLDIKVFIGNPNILVELLPVYRYLQIIDIKSIAVNHYYYFLPYKIGWLHNLALERVRYLEYANIVTWTNSFGLYMYSRFNDNGIVMPNPNTFDEKEINKNLVGVPKEKIILCVGRFNDDIKRFDKVLECFQRVSRLEPDARLIVAGICDLNKRIPYNNKYTLGELLDALRIDKKKIIFIGETDEIEKYYMKARTLILTSDSEGFGMVLTEAGSHGVPCVLFDIPGIEDIIVNGVNGFIVDGGYDDFADKVVKILQDDKLYEEMSKNASKLSRRFSKEIINKYWGDLINSLINNEAYEQLHNVLTEEQDKRYISYAINEYYKSINELLSTEAINQNNGLLFSKAIIQNNGSSFFTDKLKRTVGFYKQHGLVKTFRKVISKLF
jgi:glycosyltransferase involved in cell wall biosynthesis/GT2 family glycosyltransferase